MKHKRYIRNYLINPFVQLRMSAIMIVMILGFAGVTVTYGYYSLSDIVASLFELTEMPEIVAQLMSKKVAEMMSWLFVITFIFLGLSVGIIIFETHKILGAAYAIRRHILQNLMNGKFDQPLVLRKGDFLQDVAEAINDLTDTLNEQSKKNSK